jgi:hypothetical protein
MLTLEQLEAFQKLSRKRGRIFFEIRDRGEV